MKKLILSEESMLNTEFNTAEANRAKAVAAKMLRRGYIPKNLKRLASLLDPASKPLARSITLGEANPFSLNRHIREKSRKLLANFCVTNKILDRHEKNHRPHLKADDWVWKGITKSTYRQYRIQAIKELAAEWECTERTIYRYLNSDS